MQLSIDSKVEDIKEELSKLRQEKIDLEAKDKLGMPMTDEEYMALEHVDVWIEQCEVMIELLEGQETLEDDR